MTVRAFGFRKGSEKFRKKIGQGFDSLSVYIPQGRIKEKMLKIHKVQASFIYLHLASNNYLIILEQRTKNLFGKKINWHNVHIPMFPARNSMCLQLSFYENCSKEFRYFFILLSWPKENLSQCFDHKGLSRL